MPKKANKVISSVRKSGERVMVAKRSDIFVNGTWHGIGTQNLNKILKIIATKHKFLPRGEVEEDVRWQQIIPYLVFENDKRIFLMRRKSSHTDRRLADKYSIGVGGHINKRDIGIKSSNMIMDWARREFEEEINYGGKYKTDFLGILNDDSNDVGRVHLGLIIKVTCDLPKIAVRDEHKSGELVDMNRAQKYYKRMETWSQIVYDFLSNRETYPRPFKTQGKQAQIAMKKPNNISGILPDWVIEDYIKREIIKISPLAKDWKKDIDQVSMDFHLGSNIKLFKAGTYRFIDTRRGLPADAMEEINLSMGDPFILEPGSFAIASTQEVLKLPPDILGRLEGKSSLARLGILVHSTAARFDPGWNGAPVLELGNLGPKPAILYCGMSICAFTFEKLSAPVSMPYAGSRSDRYGGSKKAIASKIEKHGKKK